MAKFAYNNTKNISIGHMFFEFNYWYYSHISYKENLDPYSKLKIAEKPFFKLQNLMVVY